MLSSGLVKNGTANVSLSGVYDTNSTVISRTSDLSPGERFEVVDGELLHSGRLTSDEEEVC